MAIPTETLHLDWMPICENCNEPMRLIDVRAKAASLGLSIPGEDEQYIIQCCGYTLNIDDFETNENVIHNLRKHHKMVSEMGITEPS